MKIRTSFVSNSSSSSYTCNFCDNTRSGWDITKEEAEMFECDNYHTICECHEEDWENGKTDEEIISVYIEKWLPEEKKGVAKALSGEEKYACNAEGIPYRYKSRDISEDDMRDSIREGYLFEYRNNVPSKYCPICNLKNIQSYEKIDFLCYKLKINKKDIVDMVRE